MVAIPMIKIFSSLLDVGWVGKTSQAPKIPRKRPKLPLKPPSKKEPQDLRMFGAWKNIIKYSPNGGEKWVMNLYTMAESTRITQKNKHKEVVATPKTCFYCF